MKQNVNITALAVPKVHAPADNTPAIITLAATEGVKHVVDKIFGGFDDDPAAEKLLTIVFTVSGTSVTFTYPVSSADGFMDPRFDIDFPVPIQGDENTAITITLAAGGAGVAGKLNAITR